MPSHKSTASSTRINDHRLALGVKQYSRKEYGSPEDAIWVWYASETCGGSALAKIIDVSVADLKKMRSVIDEHIALLEAHANAENDQAA